MKPARVLTAALTLALFGALAPTAAGAASEVDCGPDDGRERLTKEGFSLEFDAPVVTWPGLSAPANTAGPFTPYRSAVFPFTADFAPSAAANVTISLDWANPSDYDIFVFDADGTEIGRSDDSNIDGGTSAEQVTLEDIAHCRRFTVFVRSWAGSPAEELKLTITTTPGAKLLACVAGDPAPGCAGKAAGEAPSAVADTRTRLYLGGDPGPVAMVYDYPSGTGNPSPFRGRLDRARPTGGVPNQHTRVIVGFHDQYRNPFVPHFTTTLAEPRVIKGDVPALIWASSPTQDATGTLFATLYADGTAVKTVEIKGDRIGKEPAPLAFTFTGVDAGTPSEPVSSLTLQIATRPVATSSGQTGNPADAVVTLHYGSVQFPSRITLP